MKVTPERAIKFVKLCVVLCCTWPPPKNASKLHSWSAEILWWLTFSNALAFEVCVACCVYVNRADGIMMTKVMCTLSGISHILLKMTISRIHRERHQMIIEEMETFLKCAKMYERGILTHYVNRYALFHQVAAFGFYSIAVAISFGPLFLPQSFPMDAVYPFNVDRLPVSAIIYVHQILCVFQSSSTCMSDCQLAIIIWYTAARFKILAANVESVANESEIRACIKKHYQLLRYTNEVKMVIRYAALTTIFISTLSVICAGIQMVARQPLFVKLQYGIVAVIGSVDLFIYAWPANNLSEMSTAVGWAAYSSPWIGKSPETLKSLLLLFMRSQKSEIIGAGGIFPELSLSYYAKFLSSMFSYFTTLRLVVDTETS